MTTLNYLDVENSLLYFRTGRRILLDRVLETIDASSDIGDPALLLSRLFVRLKSADSIIEKIQRKKIPVQRAEDIPRALNDIIGLRFIVENQAELSFFDRWLSTTFEVKARVDHATDTHGYGDRTLEYVLTYERDGIVYPCEVQLRTFLQNYWAGHSAFLFHKADPDRAAPHRNNLLASSEALHSAEHLVEIIQEPGLRKQTDDLTPNWQAWPIRSRVHLMVVKPHEQFVEQQIVALTGNDAEDHHRIVAAKVACYQKYTDATIVECLCANFTAFLLNEPQIYVGSQYLGKVIW
jgi:ppGpp synthetase/RelA/SpoT-type nucleotidyltranferase